MLVFIKNISLFKHYFSNKIEKLIKHIINCLIIIKILAFVILFGEIKTC